MTLYLGVDCHKKYSYVTAIDEAGQVQAEAKVANQRESLKKLLDGLKGRCEAVVEAGYNWGVLHDLLESEGVPVQVAHPTRLRAIAETQIKTDQRDSRTLAQLLRAGLIPAIHIPSKNIRELKCVLRSRMFLVKLRTMTKNRIHQILDRNHIENPGFTDLFGKAGRRFIDQIQLGETEQSLLNEHMGLLDYLIKTITTIEKQIKRHLQDDWRVKLIWSIPGFGLTLSTVVALEIDSIDRFRHDGRLASYAGLVPRLYSSGGRQFTGKLVTSANHYLKWAFIEAAWKAQISSPYCRALFQRIRKRKGANVAVVALARKLSAIVYILLKERRPYKEIGILSHG